MNRDRESGPQIVVVGPCAAGKTTLVNNLRPKGYTIKSCVQEHSFTPDLWRRFSKADVLIFLDAQLTTIVARQNRSDWTQRRLDAQRRRLSHAREHCDYYLQTDNLTREEVADAVEAYLIGRGIRGE
jgi:guanylate kinase